MATTIAQFPEKADGSMEGVFATLRINAPIAVLPNANKAREDAPDFRVINKRRGFEIGVVYGNLAPAPGGEENKRVILWNDPE
ncbi:DUF736 family protein [Aquamicrobium soli]|jgi:uncharacterized protein (DUF736 family)|uniref:DUF736 family protein n=1 Tax=Aquamicrobium soli TaxID=1811518 RepID=A0ABV7KFU0_9HYPH